MLHWVVTRVSVVEPGILPDPLPVPQPNRVQAALVPVPPGPALVSPAASAGVTATERPSVATVPPAVGLDAHGLVRDEAQVSAPLSEWPDQPGAPLEPQLAARFLGAAWLQHTGKQLLPRGLAILVAHWALETGRGEKMVGHNFGGLKGRGDLGSIDVWTRERAGADYVLVREAFRAYSTTRHGALDYIALLSRRYPKAFLAVRHGEVGDFVAALDEGGYFTDDPDAYAKAMRSLWYEYLKSGAVDAVYNQAS